MRRLAVLCLLLLAAPAAAQPTTRYPKPPVDPDRAAEARSGLWDAATHPAKAPYAAFVDEGRRKLEQGDFDGAVHVLDHAVAVLPAAPEAYALRAQAELKLQRWAACADDHAAALGRARPDGVSFKDARKQLGECQARAGQLAAAETTLADATALAPHDADLWFRLGEVRVALGKLDEAIAAFDATSGEGNPVSATLWQRAGAYDRARQPSLAEDDVHSAMINDRSLATIDNAALPLLGAGEREFLFGLAWQDAEQPHVEAALLYFRRFLALAPTSPWRRRAEEHVRELAGVALPESITRVSGNAPLDADAALKTVRAAMPRLRACLAKLPGTLLELRITRTGPRVIETPTFHVGYHAPPAGVQVTAAYDFDAKPAEVDAASRCVEPIADKLALPAIKDKETYYQVMFSVVAP